MAVALLVVDLSEHLDTSCGDRAEVSDVRGSFDESLFPEISEAVPAEQLSGPDCIGDGMDREAHSAGEFRQFKDSEVEIAEVVLCGQ